MSVRSRNHVTVSARSGGRTLGPVTFAGHSVSAMIGVPAAAREPKTIAPPEAGAFVQARIPGSGRVTLNATRHCPQLAAPEERATAVADFVEAAR